MVTDSLPIRRTLGGPMARRQLHFIYLLDTSGSMNADGKIQALNVAMTESLPLLRAAAIDNVTADVLVRAVTFSDGARWVREDAAPVDQFRWIPVAAGGLTDLGAALELVARVMTSPPMPERALAPVLVLVSDGQPTDEYRESLRELLSSTWGGRSVRMAVAIGRDADRDVLQEFIGRDSALRPAQADDPEAIVEAIQWATTAATRIAVAAVAPDPSPPATDPDIFVLDDADPT